MMRFALLVSRAFCHCSRRGGGGQGRRSLTFGASGAAQWPDHRSARPSSTGAPTSRADPRSVWRLHRESPAGETGRTGHGRRRAARGTFVSRPELAPVPRQVEPEPLARRGCGAPCLFRGSRLYGAALPRPICLALPDAIRPAIQALEKRYPMPYTVRIHRGLRGSSLIFRRSQPTCTSTVRVGMPFS